MLEKRQTPYKQELIRETTDGCYLIALVKNLLRDTTTVRCMGGFVFFSFSLFKRKMYLFCTLPSTKTIAKYRVERLEDRK